MSEKPESKSTEAAESLRGSTKASDSAYDSLTQSQRSGSSSKSQHSRSSGSNNGDNQNQTTLSRIPAEGISKSRKEKDPKKRKVIRSSFPTTLAAARDQFGTTTTVAAAASAALVTVQATGTTVAGVNTSSIAAASAAAAVSQTKTAETDPAASCSSSGKSATPGSKRKYGTSNRSAAAELRVLQAAAVTRALDYLQSSRRLKDNSSSKEESISSSWKSVLMDPYMNDVRKHFSSLDNLQAIQNKTFSDGGVSQRTATRYLAYDLPCCGQSRMTEAFAVVISLQDGVVVYATSSLTDKLGFPPEMWFGRFLLDFLHPKDRLAFTNSITTSLLSGLARNDKKIDDETKWRTINSAAESSVCCRLRKYRGLRTSGFGIVEKKTSYLPFRITLSAEKLNLEKGDEKTTEASAKDLPTDSEENNELHDGEYYLVAYAIPIVSAYNRSDEKLTTGHFDLRHSASCQFNEVDQSFVPYLGFLPQDLLGASILDFYHPNDLPSLKEIYKKVISRQGKLVRSKPYNFRAFNGCYVLLETDWTCFVNPWTKKVEFVAGQYRVLRGPSNPDVFASPPGNEQDPSLSSGDSTFTENAEKIQDEIRTMLLGSAKPIQPQQQQHYCGRSDAELRGAVARRRKDLAILMGSIIDEMAKGKGIGCLCCSSSSVGSSRSPHGGGSLIGHASVVMGDISPHHGGSRADSHSSDTPLSYTQLNYNENLQRYFQSQPKMMPSDGSGEGMALESGGSRESGGSKNDQDQTHNGSSEEDGGIAAGSAEPSTCPDSSQRLSGSKSQSNSGSNSQTENAAECKVAPLTKELLNQHNEKMEEEFMRHHRVLRHKSGRGGGCPRHERHPPPHGVKRGGGSSWEEGGKQKHAHVDPASPSRKCQTPPTTHVPSADASFAAQEGSTLTGPTVMPINLLPPFCMVAAPVVLPPSVYSIPTIGRSGIGTPVTTATVTNSLPGVMPSYYIPTGNPATAAARYPGMMPLTQSLLLPQTAGPVPVAPYSMQAIPCYQLGGLGQGVVYQPVVMPPVLLQPTVMVSNNNQQTADTPVTATLASEPRISTVETTPTPGCSQTSAKKAESMSGYGEQQGSRNRRGTPGVATTTTERGGSLGSNGSFAAESSSAPDQSISPSILGSGSSTQVGSSEYSLNSSNSLTGCSQQTKMTNGTGSVHSRRFERPAVRNTPPWMRTLSSTQEFLFKYQIPGRDLQEVLEQDRARLQYLEQPPMLDDQLQQLMHDIEAENRQGLGWDETETTASSSGTDEGPIRNGSRVRRSQFMNTLIYEENAPLPPPTTTSS